MTKRDGILWFGALCLVAAQLAATFLAPGALWGLSHLAAAPPALPLLWAALAVGGLVLARRPGARPNVLPFPNRRTSALIAVASLVPFYLLRERTHFFGDGALLIRDHGLSVTSSHAPLLVRITILWVRFATAAGVGVETSLVLLSIVSGACAVYVFLRLAACFTEDRGGRFLTAALLLTAGSMQLFYGHVEYYAAHTAVVALYLLLACRAVAGERATWPTWFGFGVLLPMHLQTLALAPAQLYLGWRDIRAGRRLPTALAVAGSTGLALVLARISRSTVSGVTASTGSELSRYFAAAFHRDDGRHAFGFFSLPHLLAFLNDSLLAAPLALMALPAILVARAQSFDPLQRFLGLAAAGGLALSVAFPRELGAYRDWDILAANGFVLLAFTAACLVRPHPGSQRTAVAIVLVAGVFHLTPWVVLLNSRDATLGHITRVLAAPRLWSPYARAYLWEEIAIDHRQRGNEDASLAAYRHAVEANPADARYHTGLGNRLFARRDFEGAAHEYEAALQHRPGLAPAHNNLACALAALGRDLDAARSHVQLALAADSTKTEYWMTLARIEQASGRQAAALDAVRAALRRSPVDREALRLRTQLETTLPRAATPEPNPVHWPGSRPPMSGSVETPSRVP